MALTWHRFWLPCLVSVLISSLLSVTVLGLRAVGAIQFLEIKAYDTWLRWQPSDRRVSWPVAIVGVNEDDLNDLKHYPLTDADLAHLLEKLVALGPRGIGIDIFRDLEQPPGRDELDALLAQHRHIIAIMTFGEDGFRVPPPPLLADQITRIGFADQVMDRSDGMIRRSLLFLDNGETAYYSLGLQLALLYLKPEGITPQPGEENPGHLRLGKTTFKPFEASDGCYSDADARGFQFLLDFKGPAKFPTFSMADVMSGQVKERDVKGKVVVVGITAESIKDFFLTPVNTRLPGPEAHAHAIDQLIRAAMDGDASMAVWSDWQETLWIIFWGIAGGVLGIAATTTSAYCLTTLGGLAGLVLTGYLALHRGVWIPVVPSALTWVFAASIVVSYRRRSATFKPGQAKPSRKTTTEVPRVFISAKSADYEHAQQVYDFLTASGVPTFFSRESLLEAGVANFREEIDQALDQAEHLILVASKIEYVNSPWVKAEWGFFINEMRSGRKSGNLLTVTVGVVVSKDLPPALRTFEVISLSQAGCEKLLNYVS